jgi:hypothetical protein
MLDEDEIEFEGFDPHYNQKHFFTYPVMLQSYWCHMSGSEQKCLDFIMRQTIGWQKHSDYIALSQFCTGIEGTANSGTGLSKSQVRRAIHGLEVKKFIFVERRKNRPSKFTIHIKDWQSEELRKGAKQTKIAKDLEGYKAIIEGHDRPAHYDYLVDS